MSVYLNPLLFFNFGRRKDDHKRLKNCTITSRNTYILRIIKYIVKDFYWINGVLVMKCRRESEQNKSYLVSFTENFFPSNPQCRDQV